MKELQYQYCRSSLTETLALEIMIKKNKKKKLGMDYTVKCFKDLKHKYKFLYS